MDGIISVKNDEGSSLMTEVVTSDRAVECQLSAVKDIPINTSLEGKCIETSHTGPSEFETQSIETCQETNEGSSVSHSINEPLRASDCPVDDGPGLDCSTTANDVHIVEVDETVVPDTAATNRTQKVLHGSEQSDTSVFTMIQVSESVCDEGIQLLDSTSDSDDCSSESDSSSSDETSSDDDSCDLTIRHKDIELSEEIAILKNSEPPKVKGEILPAELPPIEDINILLPEDSVLELIGKVTHIMPDHSVIVQSYPSKPALDYETVLFFSRDAVVGKVEETFGPVPNPLYVIRFNSEDHLLSKGVELNKEVYYAPHIQDFTSFVFVSALRSIQGSDASWCNDQEPPPSCLDYSDDEQEREARRRKKNDSSESENKRKKPVPRNEHETSTLRGNRRPRGRGRDRWHNEPSRFNVMNTPDPSQMGWQSAVNGMSRHSCSQGVQPRVPPPPSDLFHCFQRPPTGRPEYIRPPNTGHQAWPPEGGPSYHWRPAQPSYISHMFGVPPPPPPPPPP